MTTANQEEETLDRDFFLFLTMTKTFYEDVLEKDKELCKQWLQKLCGKRVDGVSQKRSRNILLSQLIMDMQNKTLSEHFQNSPTDDPLPSVDTILGNFSPEFDDFTEKDNIGGFEDFQEKSSDGKTYVAIRCLPNNEGSYAFISLNIEKEVNSEKETSCLDKSNLKKLQTMNKSKTKSSLGKSVSKSQKEDIRKNDTLVKDNFKPQIKNYGKAEKNIDLVNLLLKRIDAEIKGESSEKNHLVEFLISRLITDLEKMPKMKYIFELKPSKQRLKALQLLRQLLILKLQEKKRTIIKSDLKETMLENPQEKEPDIIWDLIIKKPLSRTNLKKLQKIYPSELISIFVDLIVEDRCLILERGQKRQNKVLENLRLEVCKEINSGKADLHKAQEDYREWNKILSTVQKTMYKAGIQNKGTETELISQRNEELIEEMMANISEIESLIKEEVQRGKELAEAVKAAEMRASSIKEDKDEEMWENSEMIENITEQIKLYKIIISNQEKRIRKLQQRLEYD